MINFIDRVSRSARFWMLMMFVVLLCALTIATTLASALSLDWQTGTLYGFLSFLVCLSVVISSLCARIAVRESAKIKESVRVLEKLLSKKEKNHNNLQLEADIKYLQSEISSLSQQVYKAQDREEHLHGLTRKRIRSKFADFNSVLSRESSKSLRGLQNNQADLQTLKHNQNEVIDSLREVSPLLTNQRDRDGIQSLEIQAAFLAFLEELRPIGNYDETDMEGPSKA